MTNLLLGGKCGLFSTIYKACTLLRTQSVLNTPAASYVSNAKIYESLQIAKPPKKPVNRFFRFMKERLDGKQLSRKQRLEAIKSIGGEWRQMDVAARAQLYPEHNSELAEYKIARAEWEKRLTEVQRAQIAAARKIEQETVNRLNEKRQHIADCVKLNKPKFPVPVIILFRQKSGNNGKPADVAEKWRKLSLSEQQQYRDSARELRDQYDKVLIKWEIKMMEQGRSDLVRKKTYKAVETPEKPKPNNKKAKLTTKST